MARSLGRAFTLMALHSKSHELSEPALELLGRYSADSPEHPDEMVGRRIADHQRNLVDTAILFRPQEFRRFLDAALVDELGDMDTLRDSISSQRIVHEIAFYVFHRRDHNGIVRISLIPGLCTLFALCLAISPYPHYAASSSGNRQQQDKTRQ